MFIVVVLAVALNNDSESKNNFGHMQTHTHQHHLNGLGFTIKRINTALLRLVMKSFTICEKTSNWNLRYLDQMRCDEICIVSNKIWFDSIWISLEGFSSAQFHIFHDILIVKSIYSVKSMALTYWIFLKSKWLRFD